jgi:hypothetical protein
MDRPPLQAVPVRIKRERRWIVFSLIGFIGLWAFAADQLRGSASALSRIILFGAPFLFLFGVIVVPLFPSIMRSRWRSSRSSSGARET